MGSGSGVGNHGLAAGGGGCSSGVRDGIHRWRRRELGNWEEGF